ncbi:MAG: molecular chaperone DnaJ [Nanoarchaeota archaeon]|nr:molecular chaperone DnaJ [Nanoarchaeota archaeon]
MAKDYYQTLGVGKNATKEDVKKAYKKLAKQFHPDLNKSADAEQKFKEINEAAAVLGDDAKRSQYDQFGDAESYKRAAGGNGASGFDFGGFRDFAGFDFGDIFDQFFSGGMNGGQRRRSKRGSNIRVDIEITLENAAQGTIKILSIPREERCPQCQGTGAASPEDITTCSECNGAGVSRRTQRTPFGVFATTSTCGTCRGRGKTIEIECEECDGTGLVKKTRKIEVKVPPGAEEGTNLRVTGEGEAGEEGADAGDLYVIIHVKEHELFERRADDLYIKVEIPFTTAALGGEVEVPTLLGKASLRIPAGTQSNTVFKMRDKGIPYLHGSGQGDELVEVVVAVPKSLSKRQKELLEEFEGREPKKKKGFFK